MVQGSFLRYKTTLGERRGIPPAATPLGTSIPPPASPASRAGGPLRSGGSPPSPARGTAAPTDPRPHPPAPVPCGREGNTRPGQRQHLASSPQGTPRAPAGEPPAARDPQRGSNGPWGTWGRIRWRPARTQRGATQEPCWEKTKKPLPQILPPHPKVDCGFSNKALSCRLSLESFNKANKANNKKKVQSLRALPER